MLVFNSPDFKDHERVTFINDPSTGLQAIIAIHSTALGPALGGCRMWNYNSEEDGLKDVLRLSRGMTYKAAMMNVALGGGKCVIIGDPKVSKSPELMKSMGREIARLNGSYITGPDIGTGVEDMTIIHEMTDYVIGVAESQGGYGDPSSSTAIGVVMGIRAGLMHKIGSDNLDGVKVAVQGLGHVGMNLCKFLAEKGARLTVCDIQDDNLQTAVSDLNATVVKPDEIYDADVDVFAPCAFGGVLNNESIQRLKAGIVSGGANNQLEADHHGDLLKEQGILYLPDYVANGGGLVQVGAEWFRDTPEVYEPKIHGIYDTCLDILEKANLDNTSTNHAADSMAQARLASQKEDASVIE